MLLKATNRPREAEPLMRRAVEITLNFTRTTGYEHSEQKTRVANYKALLEAMGYDQAKIKETLAKMSIKSR